MAEAKRLFAEKVASSMNEYEQSLELAERIKTTTSKQKPIERIELQASTKPSISSPNEYSLQPGLLNALRDAKSYNEAFEEVVDPVGAIIPNKLMDIQRPPYKRTGERRRYHKVFKLRVPHLRMFPR